MFKSVFHVIVSAATALTPLTASASQEFIFRHKYPVANVALPPADDTIGIGNDVVARYVALVDRDFSRRIPVKTTDVVEWRVVDGDTVYGIGLDDGAGVYSGRPTAVDSSVQRLEGFDGSGRRIAKAEVHIDVVKPQGVEVPVDFVAHTGHYFYGSVPTPDGIELSYWDTQFMPSVPGMSVRNEAIEGIPTQPDVYSVFMQGYDHTGRPVAYASGSLTVTDGPEIEDYLSQQTDPSKNQAYNRGPAKVDHSIGSLAFQLISLDGLRPEGMTFNSLTGKIGGIVEDFSYSGRYVVRVTDAADGTSDETAPFTLSTVNAYYGMNGIPNQVFEKGVSKSFSVKPDTNLSGLTWSLDPSSGDLPPGLDVLTSGRNAVVGFEATEIGDWANVILRVTGPNNLDKPTTPFSIKVREQALRLTPTETHVRVGKRFETDAIGFTRGRADPVKFSLRDPATLPAEVSFDASTSKLSSTTGLPEPGHFSIPIDIENGDDQDGISYHRVHVYADQKLEYPATGTITRWDFSSAIVPTFAQDAVIGTATFSISPDLPKGLLFNTRTGRISVEYPHAISKSTVGTLGPFTVTYSDDEKVPVTSDPFTILVSDGKALDLVPSDQMVDNVIEAERYLGYNLYRPLRPVRAENARLGYTISLDPSSEQLPDGLRLLPSGVIIGSTSVPVGQYDDFVFRVEDGEGASDTFGPFSIKVVPDTQLADLSGAEQMSLLWAEDRPIKPLPLAKPSNAKGALTYTLKSAPDGIDIVDGELVGTVAIPGSYTVTYEIGDDTDRDAMVATVVLEIREKMEIDEDDLPWQARKYEDAYFAPVVENGIEPLRFTIQSRPTLPQDWYFHDKRGGAIGGKVTASSGGFPVKITVEDAAGQTDTLETFVEFLPPLAIRAEWKSGTLVVGSDEGLPVVAKLSTDVPMANWALTGSLPDGIGFDSSTGQFFGNPYPSEAAAGTHALRVAPVPADTDVTMASPGSFDVTFKIGFEGEIGFPGKTFKHRVNADISETLGYTKAVSPVRFTAVSTGDGVSFDPATATFTAKFAEPGLYTAGSVKIEENDDPAFNREKTSGFGFEIVPEIALTVPSEMTFGQFDEKSVAITEVLNVIGDGDDKTPDVTYGPADGYPALPAGLSVNALTGAVEGTPEVFGDFGPFAITAFDAYGDRKNSNEFSLKIAERQQLTVSYPQGFAHFRRYGTHASAPTPINGYGPYTWSIDRTPPSGITFDPDTGSFRASSDEIVEPQTFTVTVVDSKGGPKGTATATVTVGIAERPQLSVRYDSPITFTRHIADLGKDPQRSGTVQRGGALEFTVEAAGGGDALASCIGFDAETGRFSTDPACKAEVAQGDYKVTVTDATWRNDGNSNGRAEVTVKVGVKARPAITLAYPDYDKAAETFGFQRHLVKTVRPEWNNPIDDEVTWSIAPTPPSGIVFNEDDGSITVDTPDLIADASYVVTIEDDFDGSTTFPMVLGVGERKQLEFSLDHTAVQEIELNGEYALTLDVENVIEDADATTQDVFYTITAGTLPRGIEFDADGSGSCGAAGTFCGTADVLDHNKTFPVTVRATDAFDGIVERTFTLKVVEDATPMKVTYEEPGKARVGYAWSLAAPKVEFAVGNYGFAAPALAQYGLSIDARTGLISGAPNTTFDLSFDVTITDKLGASRAVTVPVRIVSVPSPTVTVPNPVSILFNRDIPEDQQPSPAGIEPSGSTGSWTLDPTTPPPGLTFDPLTGLFGGQAADIGVYGPYTLTLRDALPGSFPSVFSFDIAMNEDPIELEELSILTKVGYPFETKAPEYDNNYKTVRFSGPELEALGLAVDPVTGTVTGSIAEPMTVKPNLVIRDATIRTTSMPVNINVLPRLRLTAPTTVTLTALDEITSPVKVTPAFVAGDLVWDQIDPDILPEGVMFDTSSGTFVGTPTKVQTVGPLGVGATDLFGNALSDRGVSNGITFVVRKGAFYMEFAAGDLPEATKRTAYSFDLIANDMFTYEGMDRSEIVWGMEDPTGDMTPAELAAKTGLSVVDGRIVGTPADEGVFDIVITAKFADRAPVKGPYTLTLKLPDTQFGLSAATSIPAGKKGDAYTFDFKSYLTPLVNIPADKVKWTYSIIRVERDEAGNVTETEVDSIAGLTLGLQNGIATSNSVGTSGDYKVGVTATFVDRSESLSASAQYTLTISSNDVKFVSITASNTATCGVSDQGEAFCWGEDTIGQLGGNGSSGGISTSPTKVRVATPGNPVLSGVIAIKAGTNGRTFCAETANGVWCWGSNLDKLIANVDFWQSVPSARQRAASPATVAVSSQHLCTLTNGSVACVGTNDSSSMAAYASSTTLRSTYFPTGVQSLHANGYNTCAIKGQELLCAGNNLYGNLGRGGTSRTSQQHPAPVLGIDATALRDFSMGSNHSCVVKSDRTTWCWGNNGSQQLGSSGGLWSTSAAQVRNFLDADKVSAGNAHNCAIKADGSVWCWGGNDYGQVGTGSTSSMISGPAKVSLPDKAVSVSSGYRHSCVVLENGDAYCWGDGLKGQLGNEAASSTSVPVKVASPI